MHYEGILEEAVSSFRSGGRNAGNRVPMGMAFMMSHSFAEERMRDEWDTLLIEYAEGNETVLETCRAAVSSKPASNQSRLPEYVRGLNLIF